MKQGAVGLLDLDDLETGDGDFRPNRSQLRRMARTILNPQAAIREIYNSERGRRGKSRTGHVVVVR